MAMSEIEWMDIFSGNLRSLLEEEGITQQELADETGLSKSTISRYINGQMMPSVSALVSIAHVFRGIVTLDDILYFGDKMELIGRRW